VILPPLVFPGYNITSPLPDSASTYSIIFGLFWTSRVFGGLAVDDDQLFVLEDFGPTAADVVAI